MFEFRKRSAIQRKKIRFRVVVALIFVLGCFGLLIDRLWVLQVERYQGLAERADRNRIALVPIAPRRGDIVDRNGLVLARSYRDYTLEIVPAQVSNLDELISQISTVIPLTPLDIRRFKRRMGQTTRYASVMLRGNLTDDEAAVFAAHSFRFPDVNLRARWVREYPQGESAAHVVGYVGRISEKDQERLEQDGVEGNYRGTDVIGKKGIEASYESVLHGKTGWEEVEVAASGKPVQVLKRIDPVPGETLHLSIDMGLQKMVEDLYNKGFVKEGEPERGALVAIDPRNGQVLAYVSAPSYDPNLFIDGIDVENWRRLADSSEHPLIDRPVSGTFPIGSTYKPFVALAALKLGVRDPNARIPDPGYFEYGNQRFRNAGGAAYGPTNMHRALVVSSDTYFFSLGPLIGVDALHDFSMLFGFGRKTGIDLDYEKIGTLPSREWKKKAFKDPKQQRWIPGETISVAVGQGYNAFTIMQLAQATSTLAADGKYIRPHLVSELENPITRKVTPTVRQPDYQIPVSESSIKLVKDALVDVTRRGTAKRSFAGAAYESAGKTGTAQVFSLKGSKYNSRNLKRNLWDHALYMGFAPAQEPKIAVALIVENGGWGASIAAPIARKVFDYWLSPQRSAQVNAAPVLEIDTDEPPEDSSPDIIVPQNVPANPEDKAPEHLPDILTPVGNGNGGNGNGSGSTRNGRNQGQNDE